MGILFASSEHAYQWRKFTNRPDIQSLILHAFTPADARNIAGKHNHCVDQGFHDNKYQIMVDILKSKFSNDLVLNQLLKGTGNAILIEDSPNDDYWGVGRQGNGQNKLGLALMEVRAQL